MQSSIARLANQKFFSTLDLKEAFYAVELSPTSIDKTAIVTPCGLYSYLRSNMGLKNSMNYYCQMIKEVLGHLRDNKDINYVDDTIVIGETFEKHLVNLQKVLKAFSQNGLILNIDKCNLIREETEFLGQSISAEGMKPVEKLSLIHI